MASENGWEPLHAGADILEWIVVPGTAVHLQVMKGWPSAIMKAYAADYNAFVEPLRDADSASFTATNSVATSNHLNGTAMDLNWNSHPFRVANAGYSPQMIATMREILDFYEDTMFWANDWNTPKDAMHHQMGYDTWNNPHTGDFIARKIRADGFSTFRRGNGPQAPTPGDAVSVLTRATGVTVAKAQQILVGVVNGLRDSECNTANRIAMWLAQIGHESAGFNATEEYQSGDESTDRWKYKGRTWIQITWQSNYAGLSKWAFGKGLIPTPTYFVDNPKKLAEIQYAGLGPAWYWTVARPQINSLCDQRNLTAVTQAINGGQNGAADRKRRYDMALALGDQLLALTTAAPPQGDDDLSAEAERMIKEMYDEYKKERKAPSRSFFAKDQQWGESANGFLWNVDGNVNEMYMTWGYLLGVSSIEADVEYVAANGVAPASWAGSLGDGWLAEVGQQWCQGLVALRAAMQKSFRAAGVAVPQAAPQVVYQQAPTPPAKPSGDTGDLIGANYRANEALLASEVQKDAADQLVALLKTKTEGNQA
jgi:predicted chitinase